MNETPTLTAALAFTDQMATHAMAAAESVDITIAALAQGGVDLEGAMTEQQPGYLAPLAAYELRRTRIHL